MTKPVENLSEIEFTYLFQEHRRQILENPLDFFVRASGYADFEPTGAQTVALKTIFGMPLEASMIHSIKTEEVSEEDDFKLIDDTINEIDLYEMMTGIEYDETLQSRKSFVDLIIGRRGGKSTIAAILAAYSTFKEDWSLYLSKTPFATTLVLSHSTELSQEILEIIKDIFNNSPVLSRLIDKKKRNTQRAFNVKVPFFKYDKTGAIILDERGYEKIHYSRVQIKVGAASKKTTRGLAVCTLLGDEIAFWGTEDKYADNDEAVLRAAKPAMNQFGDKALLIKLSSPGLKQGVLYKEYENRLELPDEFAVFKAPSWIWNNILDERALAIDYKLDPVGFSSEFRAEFVDSLSDFISPEMVDLCIVKNAKMLPPELKNSNVTYTAAIDAAFKGDRFAFSICGYHENRFKQYVMMSWKGSRKTPIKAKEIAEFIKTVCKEYGISRVHADQYAFQPLKELFEDYGIILVETPFTNSFKKQIYYNLKTMIHNQKLDLLDNDLCVKEIKQLKVEQTSTGTVRIGHPAGGTDDLSDCTAINVFLLTQNLHKAGYDIGEIAGTDYGIVTDRKTGRTLNQAPSAEMLSDIYKSTIVDNSLMYVKDPKTGKYVKFDKLEDELDSNSEMGGDFILA